MRFTKKIIAAIFAAFVLLSINAFADGFGVGYVTCDGLNVRSAPDASSAIVTTVNKGTQLTLIYCNGYNWYFVRLENGTEGFCHANYVSLTPVSTSSKGESIVAFAKTLIGKPYVYGASGPNAFDCSGFTSYVFAANGIRLPRTSRDQSNVGTTVSRDELAVGDLVFFATGSGGGVSHVGIYIGDGNIIHAATGQGKISINSLSQSYYSSRYKWAKRIF